jgi:hypothetical protein
VELQHAAAAGQLVQAVDVLRDDAADASGGLPAGQNLVAEVGLGVCEVAMHFTLLPPVFVAAFGARQELVEVHGAILRPHAPRRAKIGDPALGADAGAGQHDGRSRGSEPVGNLRRG